MKEIFERSFERSFENRRVTGENADLPLLPGGSFFYLIHKLYLRYRGHIRSRRELLCELLGAPPGTSGTATGSTAGNLWNLLPGSRRERRRERRSTIELVLDIDTY